MTKRGKALIAAASFAVLALLSHPAFGRADDDADTLPASAAMPNGRATLAPFGHVRFCRTMPAECRVPTAAKPQKSGTIVQVSATPGDATGAEPEAAFRLTAARWRELDAINAHVNANMRPHDDRLAHGRADVWTLGGAYGDCEDYALTKRHKLIERGWPSHTLLVTMARDDRGRLHAVLLARTDRGDFVLDNLSSRVLPWEAGPYRWIKRQSASNPKRWVRLPGYVEEMVERKLLKLERLAARAKAARRDATAGTGR